MAAQTKIGKTHLCGLLILTLIVLVALIFSIEHSQAQSGSDVTVDEWKHRLAVQTGRSEVTIEHIEVAPFTLLDGRELAKVKAVDSATGEIIGAVFEGDKVIDEAAARAAASAQWRSLHGAQTPETVAYLSRLQPDEKVNLAIWLAVDIAELPRPDFSPEASPSETSQGYNANTEAGFPPVTDEKTDAIPLKAEEIPDDVLIRIQAILPTTALTPDESPKSESDSEPGDIITQDSSLPVQLTLEIKAYKQENNNYLTAQIMPVQNTVLARITELGVSDATVSGNTPLIYLPGVTYAQVEEMAFWPEIDAIYIVPDTAGPSLSIARPAQNAHLLEQVGYTGTGASVAIVEGQRAFFANPYLSLVAAYDGSRDYAGHPTGVAGIIGSTHPTQFGLATGASLYSANGDYSTWGTMSNAIDWGSSTAQILNNSWYWDWSNSAVFWAADRQLDYKVRYGGDFVAVAAGNFGNGCGGNFSTYVTSPAKGYNVLTVGNYDEMNTIGWSDDVMNTCSSFGNPGSDTATPTHYKPEVAAVGTAITSTIISTDPNTAVGPIGSGTSYSSPMVAALAANMIQANGTLAVNPEATKALIMATALHNIEGDARLSNKDGVGGINASAALASVERGNFDARFINSTTSFPITFTQYANAGERVRFVIVWSSNPTADYSSDPLPADLDLTAYRSNGTTVIQSSISISNGFEIVDFIAPASETYQFKVSRFGSWSGSGTYLGSGWWRGTYRISPDVGYSDPKATPLGTHLSIYPTDWTPTNFWRGMGIRSNSSDHDLRLYSASWFEDPSTRNVLAGSSYTSPVDFILVDGNHRSATLPDQYRVSRFSGTGGYNVNWSNPGLALVSQGTYGPYTLSSSQVLKVFDVIFQNNIRRRITIIPTGSSADLAVELFRSNPSTPSTWTLSRGAGVVRANAYGVGNFSEQLDYNLPAGSTYDWLGLAIYNNVASSAGFYIQIEDFSMSSKNFLPLITR